MSRWIRLSDNRGRDAKVRMQSKNGRSSYRYMTAENRSVDPHKIIKAPMQKTYEHLIKQVTDDQELAQLLLECDPEIDLQAAGRKTGAIDRVFLDANHHVLYSADRMEVFYNNHGFEIERKVPSETNANINTEIPLYWTGKYISRSEAVLQFVFSRKFQIIHVDGLTFDFLYAMAEELDSGNFLVLIGAGSQGREPLYLEKNGLPYRGFLEGRIQEDTYLLVLHLTSQELIQPEHELL